MTQLSEIAYQVLTERGRSKKLTKDGVVKLMQQKCRRFDPNRHGPIYRGTGLDADYGFVDPSKSVRKSRNTDNYYTLLMDNSPKWKAFPNRSQSIICSNDRDDASWYGNTFYIIPFDGSKVGIAPSNDLWDSFDFDIPGMEMLEDFNVAIKLVATQFGMKIRDDSYSQLIDDLEALADAIHDDPTFAKAGLVPWIGRFVDDFLKSGWDLENYLQSLLDPKKNKFEVVSWPAKMPTDRHRELWTDGPSVMIFSGLQDEIFKQL